MAPNMDVHSRPECNESERDKYVAGLIDRLHTLERKTDPEKGPRSARGKSAAALDALEIAGALVNALAGWALDHQAGLALKDLEFVQLRMTETAERVNYRNSRSTDDDHRHEWIGRNWVGRETDPIEPFEPIEPIVARNWLMNLVSANPGIFNLQLTWMTLWALKACDYGEILPMLSATKKGRKVNWTILQLQLRAVEAVKFREARGIKKFKAQQEVAEAFGVSVDTVRSWEMRLRDELGQFKVASRLAVVAKIGKNETDAEQHRYLQEFAQQYKAAINKKAQKAAS
jgi:DNA-binding transcriptional regulator YiaG